MHAFCFAIADFAIIGEGGGAHLDQGAGFRRQDLVHGLGILGGDGGALLHRGVEFVQRRALPSVERLTEPGSGQTTAPLDARLRDDDGLAFRALIESLLRPTIAGWNRARHRRARQLIVRLSRSWLDFGHRLVEALRGRFRARRWLLASAALEIAQEHGHAAGIARPAAGQGRDCRRPMPQSPASATQRHDEQRITPHVPGPDPFPPA